MGQWEMGNANRHRLDSRKKNLITNSIKGRSERKMNIKKTTKDNKHNPS
jgi:hypothetical protein